MGFQTERWGVLLIICLWGATFGITGGRLLAEGQADTLTLPQRPGIVSGERVRSTNAPQMQVTTFFTDEFMSYVPYQTFVREYEHDFQNLAFAGFQYNIGAPEAEFDEVEIDWSGSGSCALAPNGLVSCTGEITRFYARMLFSGVFSPTASTFVLQTGGFNNGFAPDNSISLTFPAELTFTQALRNVDGQPVVPLTQTATTLQWFLPMQDNSVVDVTFFDVRVREVFVPLAVRE